MKTYHIITIGCQMNKNDSERIAAYLDDMGMKNAGTRADADLIVIATCGVRQSAEDRVYGLAPRLKAGNPEAKIVLTGCLANRDDVKKRLSGSVDHWLPIGSLAGLGDLLAGRESVNNSLDNCSYLALRAKHVDKNSAYVPIGNGCDNFCSYCVVPNARGRERYRPAEDIIDEAQGLVNRGYKEIILIAQNVNSYLENRKQKTENRTDSIYNFSDLLNDINSLPGGFLISFATSHPKDMTDELIETIANCAKVKKHIHLPAQSGDNDILKAMNRGYTREHYLSLIKKIRAAMPQATITTDIIVGFPGETREQFNNTIKLFKEVGFNQAYVAQYSPRPGTAAYKLNDDVPKAEKKRRYEELMALVNRPKRKAPLAVAKGA